MIICALLQTSELYLSSVGSRLYTLLVLEAKLMPLSADLSRLIEGGGCKSDEGTCTLDGAYAVDATGNLFGASELTCEGAGVGGLYGAYGVGARLVEYRFVGRVKGMCTGGKEGNVSRFLSGEGVLVIRGGAMWAVGVMNIEETRREVYRLDVWTCLISGSGFRCGEAGGCCGTIGMCLGNDGARRGTEGAGYDIAGAIFGKVGVLRGGGYAAAAAAGGFRSADMADTIAFGRCFGEYRCVP